MKKYSLFIFICCSVALLVASPIARGQSTEPPGGYIKYDAYYSDFAKYFLPWKQTVMHQATQQLKESANQLTGDKAPAGYIQILNSNSRVWPDESIFAKRKNSVFIVGKIISPGANGPADINFQLAGTAFAISADGVCVTNYHVLKDIIRAKETGNKDKDSVYFIETFDRKVYLIDSLLAFSKNNDLAVFKVNTHGDQLQPIPLGKPANIGAAVYCISHPFGHFYYFSKGIVARNVTIDTLGVTEGYDKSGPPPIRMEITADYGVGSSGGPIMDKYGNLIGVVISTTPIMSAAYVQMMVKDTAPIKALNDLLGK